MTALFDIKNCDTVKKAQTWPQAHEIGHPCHNFKTDGLTSGQLDRFTGSLGFASLLNRNNGGWRPLGASQRIEMGATKALRLMLETPTLIKRPILVMGNQTVIGFKPG